MRANFEFPYFLTQRAYLIWKHALLPYLFRFSFLILPTFHFWLVPEVVRVASCYGVWVSSVARLGAKAAPKGEKLFLRFMALITICGRRHGLPKPPDRRKAPVVAKKRTPSHFSVKSQTPTHSDLLTPELFSDLNSRNTSFLVSSKIVRNPNGLFLSNLISSRTPFVPVM